MLKIPATVNMVVKNEDRFIWYAIKSIIRFVDKVIITDTGSTDQTVKVIQNIHTNKIDFRQESVSSPWDISQIRQQQLADTHTDWIWIVDGDEIYSAKLIKEIGKILKEKGNKMEGIVVGRRDLLGD